MQETSTYYSVAGTALGSRRSTFWTSAWCRPMKRSESYLFSSLMKSPCPVDPRGLLSRRSRQTSIFHCVNHSEVGDKMNVAPNPACARFSGPLENDRRSLFNIIKVIGGWPPSSESERVNEDLLTLSRSSWWPVEEKGRQRGGTNTQTYVSPKRLPQISLLFLMPHVREKGALQGPP